MATEARSIDVSAARSRLSEIVRDVRRTGEPFVITIDREPVARIVAIDAKPRDLTVSERATVRTLMDGLLRIPRAGDAFDGVALVADGRR